MLANFLGKSKPINFIILLSLFICLFLGTSFSLFYTDSIAFTSLLKTVGFIGLYLIVFFFYNFTVYKNNLTLDNSYAFAIFTALLSYLLPVITSFKTLVILLLYTLWLRKIYSLKSPNKILPKLFDSGFWLGFLFILEPFSAVFTTLIYAAIFLHQKPIINYLIAPILGFSTPLVIYATYCVWFDQFFLFTNLFYFESIPNFVFYSGHNFYWISVCIAILSVISIFLKSPKTFSINDSFKKSWILLLINITIAVFFALLIPTKNGTEFLFVLFPAAVIIANGLETVTNNFIKNLFFILLIISAIAVPFLL
ncbi:MAG: hypothetical protein ACI9Z4_002418 [Polaribacter sp.]|jgi:hypothetical protein